MSNKLEDMNSKIIPDPFTGGTSNLYWNEDKTYMLCVPHQEVKHPEGHIPKPLFKGHTDENGITHWERIKE